ncbi:ATP-binding protein [Streptomyces griseofuscus]|uniref:ATP-binding protein n=1 Tax=Streptomyces griseofuscus TaxID=146922 RepID=UPI0036B0CD69
MSDAVSSTRPAAVRGRRRRPAHADEFVLGRIRRAVMTPLLHLTGSLVATVVVWRITGWPDSSMPAGVACGLAEAAFIAVRQARGAARSVQESTARASEADLTTALNTVAAAQKTVLWTADELCRGARPPVPAAQQSRPGNQGAQIEAALEELRAATVTALLRVHDESGSAVLLEILRKLAMRQHALLARTLGALDQLERLTADPELLAKIWEIDHLATRVRRQVESTAVLGGQSLRKNRQPVSIAVVLRGAVSEVVQYPRVVVAAGTVGTELGLPGHVGPNVMHLLAELIENGTEFSDPATRVIVRAQRVPAGLAIEVEDRAVAMVPQTRSRMNRLLEAPDEVDVSAQVRAGQIGLLTAAKIAQRHGVRVQLQENMTGGTTALVVVPTKLLVRITPPESALPEQTSPGPAPSSAAQPAASADGLLPSRESGQHRTAGEPPLPRRTPTRGALRSAEQRPVPSSAPVAATPGMAAAFLNPGRRSPRTAPPEQP